MKSIQMSEHEEQARYMTSYEFLLFMALKVRIIRTKDQTQALIDQISHAANEASAVDYKEAEGLTRKFVGELYKSVHRYAVDANCHTVSVHVDDPSPYYKIAHHLLVDVLRDSDSTFMSLNMRIGEFVKERKHLLSSMPDMTEYSMWLFELVQLEQEPV